MQLWRDYYTPRTVDEALALLARYDGAAQIIAGGTDLLIDLQAEHLEQPGSSPLPALIDITRVDEMMRIEATGEMITIGAAVTHAQIVKTPLIEAKATCLVESCGVVGGPQVRNVGTLGGNVAHALPAGDGTTSLVALDAQALVAWHDGQREWLPLSALYKGAGVSALDHGRDLLVALRFKGCGANEGCAFQRIMRPQGVALPILGCAVWVRLTNDGAAYADARVCITPVAPTPVRASAVEARLIGQPVGEESLAEAVTIAQETLHPRTSKYRATAEYRTYMMETLLRAALPRAVERARTGVAQAVGVGM